MQTLAILLLLLSTWHVAAKVPSEEERSTIMECHTKLRESVQPTASNMQLMTYSEELENLAQEYASACAPTYPKLVGRFENVGFSVMLSNDRSFQFDDLCKVNSSLYCFEKDTCSYDCQTYKRMVWATSTQVGCAANKCRTLLSTSKPIYWLVCLYKPGVELVDTRPYEAGHMCSKCQEGQTCYRNQCTKDAPSAGPTSTSSATIPLPLHILALVTSLLQLFK
uniref:SCP domain-containing protein n=1 Tax=Mesocestoides corti TaxID=53468 RepID=A0A5K3G2D1_MESCO